MAGSVLPVVRELNTGHPTGVHRVPEPFSSGTTVANALTQTAESRNKP